jgi:hypothetical protein
MNDEAVRFAFTLGVLVGVGCATLLWQAWHGFGGDG